MNQKIEILEDKDMLEALENAIQYEKNHPPYTTCMGCGQKGFQNPHEVPKNWACSKCGAHNNYLGWEWHDVAYDYHVVNRLRKAKLVEISHKSNNHTNYSIINTNYAIQVVENSKSSVEKSTDNTEYTEENIDSLFSDIVGHDSLKKILKKAILKGIKNHMLFIGPPASSKTLFQLAIERLPGSVFITGSNISKAGLTELLFDWDVKYLLIDEIEEIKQEDQDMLLTFMATGRITETKFGKTREKHLDTMVIGSCNRVKKLKPQLYSRFMPVYFEQYSESEFIEIAKNVLTRNGKTPELAEKIAKKVWKRLGSRDIRNVVNIAPFIDNEVEIDEVLSTMLGRR